MVTRRRFLGGLVGAAAGAVRPLPVGASTRRMEVICRQAWGARPPTGNFDRHRIRRVTVHHSAVVLRDNRLAPERLRDHQVAHQSRGWPDIAYHLLIDRHGNVYEGRPRWAVGDTATNYDPRGHLTVMCEGHFGRQRPSDRQVRALVDVLGWAVERYDVPIGRIRGHLDYADTACPGTRLYGRLGAIRGAVRARVGAGRVRLVELCSEAGAARVAEIEAGTE
jgi:hypothetical protein